MNWGYHDIRPFLASLAASILGPKESKFHLEVEASPHNLFDEFFVLGEISLLANRRKTLLPLRNHKSNYEGLLNLFAFSFGKLSIKDVNRKTLSEA